jgi:hypothetical protein
MNYFAAKSFHCPSRILYPDITISRTLFTGVLVGDTLSGSFWQISSAR